MLLCMLRLTVYFTITPCTLGCKSFGSEHHPPNNVFVHEFILEVVMFNWLNVIVELAFDVTVLCGICMIQEAQ